LDLIDIRELWGPATKQVESQMKSAVFSALETATTAVSLRSPQPDMSASSDSKKKQAMEGEEEQQRAATPTASTPTRAKKAKARTVVPIRLRLSVHNVRIHDDFDWDVNLDPACFTVWDMARSIACDLNLMEKRKCSTGGSATATEENEVISVIALAMLEQIHDPTLIAADSNDEKSGSSKGNKDSGKKQKKQHPKKIKADTTSANEEGTPAGLRKSGDATATAAWNLPTTAHISNVAHLVSLHKPPPAPPASSAAAAGHRDNSNKK
jgi:SNF5 / SMARCB1 / INI1